MPPPLCMKLNCSQSSKFCGELIFFCFSNVTFPKEITISVWKISQRRAVQYTLILEKLDWGNYKVLFRLRISRHPFSELLILVLVLMFLEFLLFGFTSITLNHDFRQVNLFIVFNIIQNITFWEESVGVCEGTSFL